MLLNAAKFQGYSFYRSRVIKGKPTGEEGGTRNVLLAHKSLSLLLNEFMQSEIMHKYVQSKMQKQPPRGVPRKSCSENM